MGSVLVLCEGHTEREFCNRIVAPHLREFGVDLRGGLVGEPGRKRGGVRKWSIYRRELLRLAEMGDGDHVGVLADYYAMPESWPGRERAAMKVGEARATSIEEALERDLREEMPDRFHPCVQLHEFESLLFVAPERTARSIVAAAGRSDDESLTRKLAEIRDECGGRAELINDSPETAPSKRISRLVPGYDKVAWGVMIAEDVTLPVLRDGCSWLDRWLSRLESLGEPGQGEYPETR